MIDAITRHLELGSYLSWSEEQRTSWLLAELSGKRPLFPPGIDLSPDEAEVVATFRYGVTLEAVLDVTGSICGMSAML